MKTLVLLIALVAAVVADGAHGHGGGRVGRRQGRRGGQTSRRGGRQEASGGYAAPSEEVPVYAADGSGDDQAGYVDGAASDSADAALAMLQGSIPGVPGEDYPIYAEVPETGFSCDGQVDGGYYADPEAECQAFHICTADGAGGLAKYSFLCPNGTILNQNYFICDWWFNFDCAQAEELYSLNDEIAAERDALAGASGAGSDVPVYGAEGSGAAPAYAAPAPAPPAEEDYPTYDEGSGAVTEAASGYGAPEASAEASAEGSAEGSGLDVYEATTVAPVEEYLPPAEARRRSRRLKSGARRAGKKVGAKRKGAKRQGRKGSRKTTQNKRRSQNRQSRG